MFPILWVLLISLKASVDALSVPPQLIFQPTLANYYGVFETVYEFPSVIINSILIAAIGTLIILVLAVPAAYSLSRLLPLGRNTMSFGIISVRTFPTIGLAIPLFLLMQNANLLDTHTSVIIANVAYSLPFGIWMIYGFLEVDPGRTGGGGTARRLLTFRRAGARRPSAAPARHRRDCDPHLDRRVA